MRHRAKHTKALKIVCIVLAVLLLGVAAVWFLAWRNGWWFYNDEYLGRKLEGLAETYYSDYRDRLITEGGVDKAVDMLKQIEGKGGIIVELGNIFVGKNAEESKLRTRFVEKSHCDEKLTLVNIMPHEPYGAKDIGLQIKLDCH